MAESSDTPDYMLILLDELKDFNFQQSDLHRSYF